jgi:putative ABC transport system substrate-binding protein
LSRFRASRRISTLPRRAARVWDGHDRSRHCSIATVAAKAATTTIPIVFGSENDPIKAGLVTSFNRPSGNATGVYFLSGGLAEKRLGLIRELLPRADLVGLLLNPNNPLTEAITTEVRATASAVGQRIEVLHASNGREIEAVFAALTQKRASAFVLSPDPLFFTRRVQRSLPAVAFLRSIRRASLRKPAG